MCSAASRLRTSCLVRLMQEAGKVVAMTAMRSTMRRGSSRRNRRRHGKRPEVSKQAAKIVLADDNFATLVRAVDLGRDIYRRISSYVRLQLTISRLALELMVYATIFNINSGVALFPL